ncbi:MAG: hypothetical protein M1833_006715 [Piccolia ochrophora]|nr:MAG: hypothetical protein M1833_006715 [Piccolia ochrophora]
MEFIHLLSLFFLLSTPSVLAHPHPPAALTPRAGSGGGGGAAAAAGAGSAVAAAALGAAARAPLASSYGGYYSPPSAPANTAINGISSTPSSGLDTTSMPLNPINPWMPGLNSAGLGFPAHDPSQLVCFTGPSGTLCVPTGTYDVQPSWYSYDFAGVQTMSVPAGGSVTFLDVAGPFTSSVDRSANADFLRVVTSPAPVVMLVAVPADPTLVCFMADPLYRRDFVCLPEGVGLLPAVVQRTPSSLVFHGGAQLTGWFADGSVTVSLNQNVAQLEPGMDDALVAVRITKAV